MNSKPVHTFKKIVNKTNVHDFFEKIKNFKRKCLSIQKTVH